MGATNFIHKIEAYSAKEAFDELIEFANINDGTESYNGSINTCYMGKCKLTFPLTNKTNVKKAKKFIEDESYGEKWVANYVDVGISSYDVFESKRIPVEKKQVIKKKPYSVIAMSYREQQFLKDFDTVKEACEYASRMALKHSDVKVIKSNKGIETLYNYQIKTTNYKTKPKLKPLPNREIKGKHLYYFYGWASC